MLKNINPNWNKSVISITILLSVVLSIFVLIDPQNTSKILSDVYGYLSAMFESVFMYGSFGLLIFLLILGLSKYGNFKVQLSNKPTQSAVPANKLSSIKPTSNPHTSVILFKPSDTNLLVIFSDIFSSKDDPNLSHSSLFK